MVKVLFITWPINIILEEQLYKNGLLLTRCKDQIQLSVVREMQAIPVNLKPCVLRKLSLAAAVLWIQEQNIKFIQVYSWVKKYDAADISWMCKQLGIARAVFYKWKYRIIPQQEQENQEITELLKEYDGRFSHILGYRRMTDWISHFNQTHFSRKRIHRIMKKLGMHSVIRKKKKSKCI